MRKLTTADECTTLRLYLVCRWSRAVSLRNLCVRSPNAAHFESKRRWKSEMRLDFVCLCKRASDRSIASLWIVSIDGHDANDANEVESFEGHVAGHNMYPYILWWWCTNAHLAHFINFEPSIKSEMLCLNRFFLSLSSSNSVVVFFAFASDQSSLVQESRCRSNRVWVCRKSSVLKIPDVSRTIIALIEFSVAIYFLPPPSHSCDYYRFLQIVHFYLIFNWKSCFKCNTRYLESHALFDD